MKILFYRYGSICENDVIEQFIALGLEVDTIEEEIGSKKLAASDRVTLVADKLNLAEYLFVFSINFFPSISDVCEIYKVVYLGWSVDSPVTELFSKSILNDCNRIFLFDKKQYEDLHHFNPNCIFHLPLGTNVSRWDAVTSQITFEDRVRYSGDIAFVGSLYSEKDPYLNVQNPSDYLQGFMDSLYLVQKNLLGYTLSENALTGKVVDELKEKDSIIFVDSTNYIKDMDAYCASHQIIDTHLSSLERIEIIQTLARHFNVDLYTRSDTSVFNSCPGLRCKGGASTHVEMPKVFHLSKINLNMTIHSIEKGIPLRVWDIMGCGGFLLTNFQEELSDYLIAGTDYDSFSCIDELIDKCDFYLKNDSIREQIARTGYEKTKNYHTYANRMPDMFKKLL